MKLFINDKLISILKPEEELPAGYSSFTSIITPLTPFTATRLQGRVLVEQGTPEMMDAMLRVMELKKLKKLEGITFLPVDYRQVREHIKSTFRVVKAGGGLVFKDEKVLMIFRLGKWDLPKGKLEKEERSLEGALREVEEECCVTVTAGEKICTTWHSYVSEGKKSLKKTTWYRMSCSDDSKMAPQFDEGIDEVRWMTEAEVSIALKNTYASIEEVFKCWKAGNVVA